jgi:hypothetical protein
MLLFDFFDPVALFFILGPYILAILSIYFILKIIKQIFKNG